VKTVAVLTTSRADFGHVHWPLKHMRAHPDLDPRLIVMGAHLSPEFGETVEDIRSAGFEADERVECLLSSDTDVGMAKTIGVAVLGLAEILDRLRPDLLLLIADRYEMLAPAATALALRIPVAHVEGGEISEGAVDDAVRNALTKISHLHFTPTADAAERVLAMGEEGWRVHCVGAPSLDHLVEGPLPGPDRLESALGFRPTRDHIVVAQHPVTLDADTVDEARALFAALAGRRHVVFCFPNADAGSRRIAAMAREFCSRHPDARILVNLSPPLYWALLRESGMLAGNSSSGIMEAASLGLPVVDIGNRQRGRTRARNVIHAPARADDIVEAMARAAQPAFREGLQGMDNPYGDGRAGRRIARALAAAPDRDALLAKRALPIDRGRFLHD
jgi:UDP-N-acetylglucosamine 2-epimerase (non-hydrolysing)/GDP/UDP-N,N'-diacetylbacillosamine 2-epimerase (hydrolysing)